MGAEKKGPSYKPHDSTWDMFRAGDDYYIIRNDLDEENSYYLRFRSVSGTGKLTVQKVHPGFAKGDHYLGLYTKRETRKFKIKGDDYIVFHEIKSGDRLKETKKLHNDFKGGDHYLERKDRYYCIRLTREPDPSKNELGKIISGTMVRGESLAKKKNKTYVLHDDVINQQPLSFWGNGDYFYLLTDDPVTGLTVKRSKSLSKENFVKFDHQYPVSDQIKMFIPSGMAHKLGPSITKWEYINGLDNSSSDEPTKFQQEVSVTIGSSEERTNEIQSYWQVAVGLTAESGAMGSLIASAEVSLETKFGGSQTKTKKQSWFSNKTVTTTIEQDIPAHSKFGIYQPVITTEHGDLLFSPKLFTTTTGEAPPTSLLGEIFESDNDNQLTVKRL